MDTTAYLSHRPVIKTAAAVIGLGLIGPFLGSWISSDVHAQVPGDEHWDQVLTTFVREDGGYDRSWANWSLDKKIEIGAVGHLNKIGKFEFYETLSGSPKITKEVNQKWSFSSKGVNRNDGGASTHASAEAPVAPGTTVGGSRSLSVEWSFTEAGQIVSYFIVEKQEYLDKPYEYIQQNLQELTLIAKRSDNLHGDKIDQGFGMVTSVFLASSGLNLGSWSKKSSFSISGSAEGMAAMTGAGEVKAGIKGHYNNSKASEGLVSVVYPAKPNEQASEVGLVPIAFEFASFGPDGKVMLRWIGTVKDFEITIDHRHGGTWITHADLTYKQNGEVSPPEKLQYLTAGEAHTFTVPWDAHDVGIIVYFQGVGEPTPIYYENPRKEISKGKAYIDIYGDSHLNVKATKRGLR